VALSKKPISWRLTTSPSGPHRNRNFLALNLRGEHVLKFLTKTGEVAALRGGGSAGGQGMNCRLTFGVLDYLERAIGKWTIDIGPIRAGKNPHLLKGNLNGRRKFTDFAVVELGG
jgi:hypothetical protein